MNEERRVSGVVRANAVVEIINQAEQAAADGCHDDPTAALATLATPEEQEAEDQRSRERMARARQRLFGDQP